MLYLFLKIIHVLSSALLFGTGLGTATYMYLAHRKNKLEIITLTYKEVVRADWLFTLTSAIVQLVTGLWMVSLKKTIAISMFWIWGAILGYAIAGICWLPVVYFQIKLQHIAAFSLHNRLELSESYYRYFRRWFLLGWPAFISLIGVFYLMVNRPNTFIDLF